MVQLPTFPAGWVLAAALFAASSGVSASEAQGAKTAAGGAARFLSLKMDRVDVRNGPGTAHGTAWVFQRAGLPVEALRESNGWREVRDAEGSTGWVLMRYLSNRRTVMVAGAGQPAEIALKARASEAADTLAMLEPGVIASLVACDGTWCQVGLLDVRGYLPQTRLWGVAAGEIVK